MLITPGWTAEFSIQRAKELSHEVKRLCRQGQCADAIPLAENIITICEKSLGQNHPETALALSSLASIYSSLGAYDKANPLYKRSLAIQEKVLGPHHPDTIDTLNSLFLLRKMILGAD